MFGLTVGKFYNHSLGCRRISPYQSFPAELKESEIPYFIFLSGKDL